MNTLNNRSKTPDVQIEVYHITIMTCSTCILYYNYRQQHALYHVDNNLGQPLPSWSNSAQKNVGRSRPLHMFHKITVGRLSMDIYR